MNQFCAHVHAALVALARNGVRIGGCGECETPWVQCVLCGKSWNAPHSRGGWLGAANDLTQQDFEPAALGLPVAWQSYAGEQP